MKYFFALLFIPCFCFAQTNDRKVEKLSFCGWKLNDKEKIRSSFQTQFDFLKVHDRDTIVDIGAQSGSYEGCFLAVNDPSDLSFVLVDIDSRCLTEQKVKNMVVHYSAVKGDSIKANFILVQNTTDSLFLPLDQYKKVWIFNTLHEIPDQGKMVRDIYSVLRTGGEVIVLELAPKSEGQLHGGCKKPLLPPSKIKELFTSNGFSFSETVIADKKKRFDVQLFRFIKD